MAPNTIHTWTVLLEIAIIAIAIFPHSKFLKEHRMDERSAFLRQVGQLLSDLIWLDQGAQPFEDLQGLS